MEFILSYCHFSTAIIFAILCSFLIYKNPRSLLNITCAAVLACLFIWSACMTVIHHPLISLEAAAFFERIGSIGWIWFTFFFLWFAWLYSQKPSIRYFRIFVFFFLIIPFSLNFEQLVNSALIHEHLPRSWGWLSVWSNSMWTYLFFAYYSISIIAGLYFLISTLIESKNPIIKRQSITLLITGLLSMILGTVINVIIPIASPHYSLPIADITTLIWAVGLAYAAFRYQLLDITPFIAADRIIAVMNDLLFLLDLRGRIISVNQATIKSLGCSEKQLVGCNFSDFILKNDSEHVRILKMICESASTSVETIITVPPGPHLPVMLSTSLIPGTGIVCVAHDISLQKLRTESLHIAKKMLEDEVSHATSELQKTNQLLMQEISDHKQAAAALMETEERFRVIFENAPDGMYLADKSGILLDANREALRISGLEKPTIIGSTINQLGLNITPLTNTISATQESLIVRSDGISIPVEISIHTVKIRGRELSLGVVRDLSQRKKAESEAEQLKAELHQAQKMEAIGRLAGGIAHDFNNLLGGIIGYTGLLHRNLETQYPAAASMAGKIQKVANQASERVAQLLAFARKGKYQVEPVDMHMIIDEVIGLLENTIDKKITLTRNFNAKRSTISGDRSQIHSAILNLAVNARDALPQGGMITFTTEQITITTETVKNYTYAIQPGGFLEIRIRDNGTGMDEATRAHVFEPFFSTKEQGKGTGLGLASVYGTVKHHNGFIELETSPGKGSTFIVSLPLSSAVSSEPVSLPVSENYAPHPGTILIVDDVEIIREMMSDTLKDVGYYTHEFEEGTKALEWFRSNADTCDLIILDLTMPNMSGRECFFAFKDINPNAKVIITSGHAMDTEIGEILRNGALAFVQKPFEINDLISAVRKVLK